MFQHENYPKHRAEIVTECLDDNTFKILAYPAQSPNLISIEKLLAYSKKKEGERRP